MSYIPEKISSPTEVKQEDGQFEEFFQTLEKDKFAGHQLLGNYQGSWFDADILKSVLSFQKHFKANESDIILATVPKSGITWLKGLTFSIVNRHSHSVDKSPLLFSNPHHLVPFIELLWYQEGKIPDMDSIPCPRIFATHLPMHCLPSTILDCLGCPIIYLCRNPLDVFTSMQHFIWQNSFLPQSISIDRTFESFCRGVHLFGPFWDHNLGYWNASLKNPQKVLFLKYEDLTKDINGSAKKIANFLGYPFSAAEEEAGLVEEITMLCSLKNLKNLECNKEGKAQNLRETKHSSFFRKGEVGDWVNLLTPSMANRLEKLIQEKFGESGLALETKCKSIS